MDVQETTGDYFRRLRIPLLRGRVWSAAENQRAAHVAVINQEMARRFWPGGDPIGQSIRLPEFKPFTAWILAAPDSSDWLEIIGVAGDTPNRGLREPVAPAAYVPYTLLMGDSMNLVIRTEAAPMTMVRAVREQIHSVDAGQPVGKIADRRGPSARRGLGPRTVRGLPVLGVCAACPGACRNRPV